MRRQRRSSQGAPTKAYPEVRRGGATPRGMPLASRTRCNYFGDTPLAQSCECCLERARVGRDATRRFQQFAGILRASTHLPAHVLTRTCAVCFGVPVRARTASWSAYRYASTSFSGRRWCRLAPSRLEPKAGRVSWSAMRSRVCWQPQNSDNHQPCVRAVSGTRPMPLVVGIPGGMALISAFTAETTSEAISSALSSILSNGSER